MYQSAPLATPLSLLMAGHRHVISDITWSSCLQMSIGDAADAPLYLTDMISRFGKGSQRLRSAAHGNLAVRPTRTVRMGPRSFAVSGPTLWNSLPVELKTMQILLESFKLKLKTYLFTKA